MEQKEKSEKKRIKQRLREWGGIAEKSGRKQEELKRILCLREEQEKLWGAGETGQEAMERKLAEDIERLKGEIAEILQKKEELDRMLLGLTEEERWFVQMRFEKGYGFDYIGMKMHISRASLFRMQDRILNKLMKVETL